jgi:beta-galactosidase
MKRNFLKSFFVIAVIFVSINSFGKISPRIHENIDFEWKFNLGDVENGNVESDFSYKGNMYDTYFGRAQAIVQSSRTPGQISLKAKAEGLPEAVLVIESKK